MLKYESEQLKMSTIDVQLVAIMKDLAKCDFKDIPQSEKLKTFTSCIIKNKAQDAYYFFQLIFLRLKNEFAIDLERK